MNEELRSRDEPDGRLRGCVSSIDCRLSIVDLNYQVCNIGEVPELFDISDVYGVQAAYSVWPYMIYDRKGLPMAIYDMCNVQRAAWRQ